MVGPNSFSIKKIRTSRFARSSKMQRLEMLEYIKGENIGKMLY
jgi:hypothetical protein